MEAYGVPASVKANSQALSQAVFRAVQIRRPEQLYSLLHNFPSLYRLGIDLPKLSSDALRRSNSAFQSVTGELEQLAAAKSLLGANYPPGAPAPPGFTVPIPAGVAPGSDDHWMPPLGPGGPGVLDLYVPRWPVRDQELRGTCVAHAIVACREHLSFEAGADPEQFNLSEQFLFWATKTQVKDPAPAQDGTWIRFAWQALKKLGVCREDLWPYDGSPRLSDVTHAVPGVPSPEALADGLLYSRDVTEYADGGSSARLLDLLTQTRRPVAISLPVFKDSLAPHYHNWNTPVGVAYGEVLDPPPTAVVTGGHAVCVVGFAPDEEELMGGYFIIRNSWGVEKFGRQAPEDGWYAPEPGYGQVSASYIEKYLWELCVL